jgi:malate synthase
MALRVKQRQKDYTMNTTNQDDRQANVPPTGTGKLEIRDDLVSSYPDVYTSEVIDVLASLAAKFNAEQKALMAKRINLRADRALNRQRITFLDPEEYIPRTNIKVQDARDGKFVGSEIPADLQRQWIQGTGPGAKPNAPLESSIRNIAYALLSGADGWMFDGEDALGQISTMSPENQRNLKLAINKDAVFM